MAFSIPESTQIAQARAMHIPPPRLEFLSTEDIQGDVTVTTTVSAVRVKVNPPFRIVVDGNVYTGGDELDIPDDEHARFWTTARWVSRIDTKSTASKGEAK